MVEALRARRVNMYARFERMTLRSLALRPGANGYRCATPAWTVNAWCHCFAPFRAIPAAHSSASDSEEGGSSSGSGLRNMGDVAPGNFVPCRLDGGNVDETPASGSSRAEPAPFGDDGYITTNLDKWGLLRGTRVWTFRYDRNYHKMQREDFLNDLFSDARVREALRDVLRAPGASDAPATGAVRVESESLRATQTSLSFFDGLQDPALGIAREDGTICKCMDEYYDGFLVADKLREFLLNEESENAGLPFDAYGEDAEREFLFVVFRHLVIGGSLNQFEDMLQPYLETTKRIYKRLLTVRKHPKTGKADIASQVYAVRSITLAAGGAEGDAGGDADADAVRLFPPANATAAIQTWLYVTTDPYRRVCKVFFHNYQNHW